MRRMYSKEELSKIIKEADFSGVDLKVKTLEQVNPNYVKDLGAVIEALSDANKTYTNIYSKLEQYGNILYIVINFKITALADGTYGGETIDIENIPSEIGEKIYDMKGKKLTEVGEASITIMNGGSSATGTANWSVIGNAYFNHRNENRITAYLGASQAMTTGGERYYTLRSFIIL